MLTQAPPSPSRLPFPPPQLPPPSLLTAPRLVAVWSHQAPPHVMRAAAHYLAMLVELRSESKPWDVRMVYGPERGGLTFAGVELLLDLDSYVRKRDAERVFDAVRAEVRR